MDVHYVPDFFKHCMFMLIKCDISDAILSHSATHDQHFEKYNRSICQMRNLIQFLLPTNVANSSISFEKLLTWDAYVYSLKLAPAKGKESIHFEAKLRKSVKFIVSKNRKRIDKTQRNKELNNCRKIQDIMKVEITTNLISKVKIRTFIIFFFFW